MNKLMSDYAKNYLKRGLRLLPESNVKLFARMYSPNNTEADIDTVVDNMPEGKLDWAMQQVERTLQKQGISWSER